MSNNYDEQPSDAFVTSLSPTPCARAERESWIVGGCNILFKENLVSGTCVHEKTSLTVTHDSVLSKLQTVGSGKRCHASGPPQ